MYATFIIVNTCETQAQYPRNCALRGTALARRGPVMSEARPAAAAAASKWPMFDLSDAAWSSDFPCCNDQHRARVAAPTCDSKQYIQWIESWIMHRGAPRSDHRVQCLCRALLTTERHHSGPPRSLATGTTRLVL